MPTDDDVTANNHAAFEPPASKVCRGVLRTRSELRKSNEKNCHRCQIIPGIPIRQLNRQSFSFFSPAPKNRAFFTGCSPTFAIIDIPRQPSLLARRARELSQGVSVEIVVNPCERRPTKEYPPAPSPLYVPLDDIIWLETAVGSQSFLPAPKGAGRKKFAAGRSSSPGRLRRRHGARSPAALAY